MQQSLKIISLNVEINKHYGLIFPFFIKEDPDIILLQEVIQGDLPIFERNLNMHFLYLPLANIVLEDSSVITSGTAIFSKFNLQNTEIFYYRGNKETITTMPFRKDPQSVNRAILKADVEVEGEKITFFNTHFTWTLGATPSSFQLEDFQNLLDYLKNFNEFVLVGDFNTPRGFPIFDELSKRYKDNIPSHITSTLDPNIHRVGDLPYVVDGLFTTPTYTAENVKVTPGLSDHQAIIANIKIWPTKKS